METDNQKMQRRRTNDLGCRVAPPPASQSCLIRLWISCTRTRRTRTLSLAHPGQRQQTSATCRPASGASGAGENGASAGRRPRDPPSPEHVGRVSLNLLMVFLPPAFLSLCPKVFPRAHTHINTRANSVCCSSPSYGRCRHNMARQRLAMPYIESLSIRSPIKRPYHHQNGKNHFPKPDPKLIRRVQQYPHAPHISRNTRNTEINAGTDRASSTPGPLPTTPTGPGTGTRRKGRTAPPRCWRKGSASGRSGRSWTRWRRPRRPLCWPADAGGGKTAGRTVVYFCGRCFDTAVLAGGGGGHWVGWC